MYFQYDFLKENKLHVGRTSSEWFLGRRGIWLSFNMSCVEKLNLSSCYLNLSDPNVIMKTEELERQGVDRDLETC